MKSKSIKLGCLAHNLLASAQFKRTLQGGYTTLHTGLYKEDVVKVLLSVCVRACVCIFVCMFIMSTLYGSITVNLAICFLKLNCQK